MKTRKLNSREVLARMKKGDLPHLRGGYTYDSAFEDGALVSHATMYSLMNQGLVERPEGTSITAKWTLRTK
jgi:hypothetical protein